MKSIRFLRASLACLALLGTAFSAQVQAASVVTYNWTTTSQGYGMHVGQPTTASFDVALSAVQSGQISYSDIFNIRLTYPGLSFDNAVVSSVGMDSAAFVNPLTGAFVYRDDQQGLAVIAFAGASINDATTFLSITVDSAVGTSVKDQFNALNNGNAYAGYPTAGYWTASMPPDQPGNVPEPASLALLGLGLAGIGFARRRKL